MLCYFDIDEVVEVLVLALALPLSEPLALPVVVRLRVVPVVVLPAIEPVVPLAVAPIEPELVVPAGDCACSSGMQSMCTGLCECSFAWPVSLFASLPAFGCGLPELPAMRSLHSGLPAAVVPVVLPTVGPVVVLLIVPVVVPVVERVVRVVFVDGLLDVLLVVACCFEVSVLLLICANAGMARAAASAIVLAN